MGSAKCRPCAACNRTSVPALPGGGHKARQAEDAAPYKCKCRFFDKLAAPVKTGAVLRSAALAEHPVADAHMGLDLSLIHI